MDFALTDDQQDLAGLCRKILDDQVTQDRLKEVEGGDEWFDRRTWQELAVAGILGIALPERYGGGGLGFVELAIVCEEVGRHVAPVPLLPSLAGGALAIAEFGTEEQRYAWLPGAASGATILTIALEEPGAEPRAPTAEALPNSGEFTLTGTKHMVPVVHLADRTVVSATVRSARWTTGTMCLVPVSVNSPEFGRASAVGARGSAPGSSSAIVRIVAPLAAPGSQA